MEDSASTLSPGVSVTNRSIADKDLNLNHETIDAHYAAMTAVILLVSSALSFIGNSIIIVIVLHKKSLRTVTHALVSNLSLAHVLTSVLCVPLQAAMLLQGGTWTVGLLVCKVTNFLHSVFSSASMLALSTIAIDRYYSVVHPLERKMTMFKGKLMIFYTWLHSTVICLPLLFVYKIERGYCVVGWNHVTQGRVYFVCYTILTVFLPLISSCLAYCFVWRAFRISQMRVHVTKSTKRKRNRPPFFKRQTEVRLIRMLLLMMFCFIILRGPDVVYRYQYYFSENKSGASYNFMLTAMWIANLVCVMDPVIYGYLNKHFRKALYDSCSQCPVDCANALNMNVTVTTIDPYQYYQSDDLDMGTTTPSQHYHYYENGIYHVHRTNDDRSFANEFNPKKNNLNVKQSVASQLCHETANTIFVINNAHIVQAESVTLPVSDASPEIGNRNIAPTNLNNPAKFECDPSKCNKIILSPINLNKDNPQYLKQYSIGYKKNLFKDIDGTGETVGVTPDHKIKNDIFCTELKERDRIDDFARNKYELNNHKRGRAISPVSGDQTEYGISDNAARSNCKHNTDSTQEHTRDIDDGACIEIPKSCDKTAVRRVRKKKRKLMDRFKKRKVSPV